MDILDEGSSLQPVLTGAEMSVFLAIKIQMEQCFETNRQKMSKNRLVLHSILTKRWNGTGIYTSFNFCISQTTGMELTQRKETGRMWEVQNIFEILNRKFSRFHNPSENMATDEVIVLFRGIIYSENIFPRSTNFFFIKLHKLHNWIHKSMFGKGQKGYGDTADSNPHQWQK